MNILTHNGTITIRSLVTGDHRTFKVSTIKQGALEGKRIVSLLSGPDNTSDYRGFGFVTENGIALWKKNQTEFFTKCARILEKPEQFKVEVLFEERCRRCNRKLTHPESILSGIGPECANKGL